MELRTATRLSGVVGGTCWLTRYVMDAAGAGDGSPSTVLYFVGLGLLFLVLVHFGTGLVSKGAVWLRAIVGVAFPLLVWSVLEAFAPGLDPSLVDAVFGGAVLLLCVQQLVSSGRSAERAPRRAHGSHAR